MPVAKKAPVKKAPEKKPYIRQFMRGVSKIGRTSPELKDSENIWLISEIDAYLRELDKLGYELVESFLVYNTEKSYYVHYVMKLRLE